jgi:hypothetical protein
MRHGAPVVGREHVSPRPDAEGRCLPRGAVMSVLAAITNVLQVVQRCECQRAYGNCETRWRRTVHWLALVSSRQEHDCRGHQSHHRKLEGVRPGPSSTSGGCEYPHSTTNSAATDSTTMATPLARLTCCILMSPTVRIGVAHSLLGVIRSHAPWQPSAQGFIV